VHPIGPLVAGREHATRLAASPIVKVS